MQRRCRPSAIPAESARTACAIRWTWQWTVRVICMWPTRTTIACSNTALRSARPPVGLSASLVFGQGGSFTATGCNLGTGTINASYDVHARRSGAGRGGRSVRLRSEQQSRARVQSAARDAQSPHRRGRYGRRQCVRTKRNFHHRRNATAAAIRVRTRYALRAGWLPTRAATCSSPTRTTREFSNSINRWGAQSFRPACG